MKKIFTLFAAMLVAAAVNASKPVSPGTNTLHGALSSASSGDTLVLADGTYVENKGGGYITFNKNVTVIAADGATPTIEMYVPAVIKGGVRVEIKGLKFDATHLLQETWYDRYFWADDSVPNNRLIFDGCEFCNDTLKAAAIYCASNKLLDSLIINNCYFHDMKKSCVFLENTNVKGVIIKNSTFANISTVGSYYAGVIDPRTTAGEVLVDHCTFYNADVMNHDYGMVRLCTSKGLVSNCIFAMPTSADSHLRAIYAPEGESVSVEAKNCLSYNLTADSGYGMRSKVKKSNCAIGDPLFVDAANGNFVLGEGSPALTAGTDGKAIGDPHWASSRTLYLKPNGNWKSNNAKFAVNGYGSGHGSLWSGFMTLVDGTSDIYTTTIPVGFDKVIFTRQDKDASSPSWNSKWNQSKNMAIEEPLDFCVIVGDGDWDGTGTWFKYGIALSGEMNSWSKSADLLELDGDDYKITVSLSAGEYFFKIIDHGDYRAADYWFKRDATSKSGISGNDSDNMKLVADKDGDYTITWTRATGTLSVTFPTATAIDNTVVGEKAVKLMENGQIVIIKNGVRYNVLGTVVR